MVADIFDQIDLARLSRAECAELLAQVKALEGQLLARLLADHANSQTTNAPESDRLLTIEQAAELLTVSKSWLYHKASQLGLARKLANGTLRFSFIACQKYIKRSRP
jgi:predicted DNA-binding transcriptional regulator AlpA